MIFIYFFVAPAAGLEAAGPIWNHFFVSSPETDFPKKKRHSAVASTIRRIFSRSSLNLRPCFQGCRRNKGSPENFQPHFRYVNHFSSRGRSTKAQPLATSPIRRLPLGDKNNMQIFGRVRLAEVRLDLDALIHHRPSMPFGNRKKIF